MKTDQFERLLRWYPAHWRARYGEELLALMEDTYGEAGIPLSSRLAIMWAGAAEHLRGLRSGSHEESSGEKVRSGSLLVLCGWLLVVVAGSAFAKMTEHWITATPEGDRRLPGDAYDAVQVAAVVGLVVIVVAATIALPATWRFLRGDGWHTVLRPVGRALLTSFTTGLLTIGMVVWSHHLGPAQHNGGRGTHLVGSLWALLVVATLGCCTFAAVVIARQLRFTQPILRLEGLLAMVLTLAMIAVIGGTLAWTISVANDAPALLSGRVSGLFGLPGPAAEIITALLMLAGVVLALGGTCRVARAIRAGLSEGAPSQS